MARAADDARMWRSTALSAAILAASAAQEPAGVELAPRASESFRYEPGRLAAGRVYRYAKSNLDGTDPSELALYLADETRFELLRWSPGVPAATLVAAEMDWEVASLASLSSYRIDERGERSLVAGLETSPDRRLVVARVDGRELACALERFPWHSLAFDLASLNVALRFLADPVGEVELEIIDLRLGPLGAELVAKGPARLAYAGEEERAGLACRRYSLSGPGLEGRGGSLWVARGEEAFLVALELEQPGAPGMDSLRLEWRRNESTSPGEWQEFVAERKDSGAR